MSCDDLQDSQPTPREELDADQEILVRETERGDLEVVCPYCGSVVVVLDRDGCWKENEELRPCPDLIVTGDLDAGPYQVRPTKLLDAKDALLRYLCDCDEDEAEQRPPRLLASLRVAKIDLSADTLLAIADCDELDWGLSAFCHGIPDVRCVLVGWDGGAPGHNGYAAYVYVPTGRQAEVEDMLIRVAAVIEALSIG